MYVLIVQNVIGVPSMDSQPNPNGQRKLLRESNIQTDIYSFARDRSVQEEVTWERRILKAWDQENMAHRETVRASEKLYPLGQEGRRMGRDRNW